MVTHRSVLADSAKLIELQNREYYALYDQLAKNISKKEQIEILELNLQFVPENKSEVG